MHENLIYSCGSSEYKRILTSWSYRWSCEIFHEFGKQSVGFEAAQVRKEERAGDAGATGTSGGAGGVVGDVGFCSAVVCCG